MTTRNVGFTVCGLQYSEGHLESDLRTNVIPEADRRPTMRVTSWALQLYPADVDLTLSSFPPGLLTQQVKVQAWAATTCRDVTNLIFLETREVTYLGKGQRQGHK